MDWPSRGGGRRRSRLSAALLLFLVFAAALTGHCTSASRVMRGGGVATEEGYTSWDPASTAAARRGLVGPGSSPPTCRSRCGGCHPCRPVHVAIQPGRSFLLEYYPEAWRCKCGNKLFMP
ncbi:hypothetical protein EJB05_07934 [Eragrostis curvula]|uniref:Epidermal patterning factor-like protein n=1 Tax=Eragrostis curvula TaxID=38414 RepID=A0A5J9WJP6_9POAL|nr:hypothetical protein EJB05_07934 [Eragrostis curvula]